MTPSDYLPQYEKEGMFIIKGFVSEARLWNLQEHYINALTTKRALYPELEHPAFLPNASNFCFEPDIEEVALNILGPNCKILGEKFVIKWPTKDNTRPYIHFWHQDSAYIGAKHAPYLTCLIAIDDSTVDNAALSVVPFSHFKPNGILNHTNKGRIDEFQNSDSLAINYGDEVYPGEKYPAKHVVNLAPGDMLVFSSMNLHGSGINTTDHVRRSYLVHFSKGTILNAKGDLFWRSDNLQ